MHSPKRIKITDVNPHLICVLCGGYYVDATTVIECLHSFCKTCIVKYLEKNKYCPICDVQIHKTTPLLNIRPDKTLQNIVYKLVPSLFKNEMQRRVEFYQKHQAPLPAHPEQRGEVTDDSPILLPDELLIICLEHQGIQPSQQAYQRYLHCPAALTVSHLIKLIRGKFNLNSKHQVHLFFKDDLLMDHITLMDIAYTYQCKRKVPIQLTYKILELRTKIIRIINREPKKEEKREEKEWKEVQLQISENGVMSVRNIESCECSPIPAVEAPPVYSPSPLMASSSSNNFNSSSLVPAADTTASPATAGTWKPGTDVEMDTTPFTTFSPLKTVDSLSDSVKQSIGDPPPVSLPGAAAIVSSPSLKPAVVSSVSSPVPTPPPITSNSSATPITPPVTPNSSAAPTSLPITSNSIVPTPPSITSSVSTPPPKTSNSFGPHSPLPNTSNSSIVPTPLPITSTVSTPPPNIPSTFSTHMPPSITSNSSATPTSLPVTSNSSAAPISLPVTSISSAASTTPPITSNSATASLPLPITSSTALIPMPTTCNSPATFTPPPVISNSSVFPAPQHFTSTSTPPTALPHAPHPSSPMSNAASSSSNPTVSSAAVVTTKSALPALIEASRHVSSPQATNPLTMALPSPPASKSIPVPPPGIPLIPSPLISQAVSIIPPIPAAHTITTPSVSVGTYPTPALTSSPSISMPQLLIAGNMQSSSTSSGPGIVTTMAAVKSSTNLVPSSFPIMSPCRTHNEPILSVSKVSKDQVRKPNNVIEVNKLSISRVPPGGMKEKGENLNKIVNKLSPNERVIGNTSVTIRPVTNNTLPPPKMYPITRPMHTNSLSSPQTSISKEKPPQVRYKTLKSPTKQWNPSIDRATQMQIMKQNADQSKPPRFFKMRNMPRFLGNPSSGVKPLYACPEEPASNQNKQKLTLMKVDPKSVPTSSIPRSPTKQPPPYTPGSPKLTKPPPDYPGPKPPYPNRMPSPAHAGSFLPPNPYHLLYSGYPGFSPEANRMLSPELIRSMCAYHPSLPPSIGMLFNPGVHPSISRPQESYKPDPTPAVQRIPPSKTDNPSPKPPEDKRFPSPSGGSSENKRLTPTSPSVSPKEVEKPQPPPVSQESKTKPIPAGPPAPEANNDVKENHKDSSTDKQNNEENIVVKMNCDDININNNVSKESPPSQPSECLASRPQ